MADDDQAQNAGGPSTPPATTTTTEIVPNVVEDRTQLVHRARTFLTSPAVQHQDLFAKRRFLLDKGLNEPEIEGLLRELVGVYTGRAIWSFTRPAAATITGNTAQDLPVAAAVKSAQSPHWNIQTVLLDNGRNCGPCFRLLCMPSHRSRLLS